MPESKDEPPQTNVATKGDDQGTADNSEKMDGTGKADDARKADRSPKTRGLSIGALDEIRAATRWMDEIRGANSWAEEIRRANSWMDEMRRASGWMDDIRSAAGSMNEMRRALDEAKSASQSLRELYDQSNSATAAIRRAIAESRAASDTSLSFYEDTRQAAAAIRAAMSPTEGMQAIIEQMRLDTSAITRSVEALRRPLFDKSLLDQILAPTSSLRQIREHLGSMTSATNALRTLDLAQNLHGVVAATLAADENAGILDAIRAAVDEAPASDVPAGIGSDSIPSSTAEGRSTWIEWYRTQPATVQVAIFILLNAIIFPIISALWARAIDRWFESKSDAERQQVTSDYQPFFGDEFSGTLLCVRADGLPIRAEPKSGAPLIGRLGIQGIEIVEHRDGFTLIRYYDFESNLLREGWTASDQLLASC
jgi:hypothetical protein